MLFKLRRTVPDLAQLALAIPAAETVKSLLAPGLSESSRECNQRSQVLLLNARLEGLIVVPTKSLLVIQAMAACSGISIGVGCGVAKHQSILVCRQEQGPSFDSY